MGQINMPSKNICLLESLREEIRVGILPGPVLEPHSFCLSELEASVSSPFLFRRDRTGRLRKPRSHVAGWFMTLTTAGGAECDVIRNPVGTTANFSKFRRGFPKQDGDSARATPLTWLRRRRCACRGASCLVGVTAHHGHLAHHVSAWSSPLRL
jgi:hypothetical protein